MEKDTHTQKKTDIICPYRALLSKKREVLAAKQYLSDLDFLFFSGGGARKQTKHK